jgi:hypothetical protein
LRRAEPARIPLSPLHSKDSNGDASQTVVPPIVDLTAIESGSFTAESSWDDRAYNGPYDPRPSVPSKSARSAYPSFHPPVVACDKPPSASTAPLAPVPDVQTAHAYNLSLVSTQAVSTPFAPTDTPPSQLSLHHQPHHVADLSNQAPKAALAVTRLTTVGMVELRALQCEVTTMLLHWLFPKASQPPDEAGLLHRINNLWYHGKSMFRPELGAHYDLTSHVLTAWLRERYAIASLRHALAIHPGLPSSSSEVVNRLLAMNDLRALRLKWKNMSPVDGMSPEEILVRASCALTMTEHTEPVFREGLSGVEQNDFEFLLRDDGKSHCTGHSYDSLSLPVTGTSGRIHYLRPLF